MREIIVHIVACISIRDVPAIERKKGKYESKEGAQLIIRAKLTTYFSTGGSNKY